ncbi:Multiple PDZ domain protein [Orchesella cincta]|uniref:Multiple PDZ domain protein n=1 Tax=Orchesella cincta TaxID=48709 RepID=A0A1D2MTJ7_ORCCI|nr:Multiple PDZ domain protein [Orchesella cincta]
MPLPIVVVACLSDVESVLGLLDQMQTKMKGEASDPRMLSQVNDEINTLLSVLTNPMFQRICKIKVGHKKLQLVFLKVFVTNINSFLLTLFFKSKKDSVNELGDQMIRHPSITTNDFDITPEGTLVVKISPPAERYKANFDTTLPFDQAAAKYNGEAVMPITTPTYEEEFERVLTTQAQGRQVHKITLFKPEGGSLGFSVVGLKSQEKGELGIFVQELQPNGIAARDGRLQEGDQILAIDGQPLDSAITHQQAIGILQQSRGEVEIVIARAPDSAQLSPTGEHPVGQPFSNLVGGGVGAAAERPTSASSNTDSKFSEMVLNTEWAQVEVIELINDGTGLGFGIIGGRSTGVVVKTILPGGVADRDGRLQSGDHILQIGDVNLLGMGSEQVAAVLRQCGSCVRLVVARPIEPTSPDALSSHAPIVPTRILGDPDELERHLIQSNGYSNHLWVEGSMSMGSMEGLSPEQLGDDELSPTSGAQVPAAFDQLPEVEIVDVELHKDSHGLGITIAGYVCEKEELSGIFVKSISEGSAADLSKRIQINDRIVEVDGQSLQGFNNHEAVEVLRKTGPIVMLKLERYHHGSKYEQVSSPAVVDNEELAITPGIGEEDEDEAEEDEEEEEEEEDEELIVETTTTRNEDMDLEDLELLIDTRYEGEILATVEAAIMAKWSKIMGQEVEVVVSQLSKSKEGGGLGISLEGTVDVEDGREVRPHHYIRSILADGPVGKAGQLLSGDELLEVNGRRLLGLNHVEVVSILKDLPMHVRLVCARRPGQPPPSRPIDTAQDRNAFAARNILGGSLQNLFQGSDRLVKAKSDGSLASTNTNATDTSLSKLKSRSLEPLTGLAMWSSEPHVIELPKGERGLGFSILDYQDPMNPSETVIVIRSLVPGGVAQQDGRLIPGDRLLAVNDSNLENASLDQAVQALKGAPRGIVRIIVAKPLPLPDTTTMSTTTTMSNTTTHSQDVTPPPPLPLSPPPEVELGMTRKSSTASEKSTVSRSGASSVKMSPADDTRGPNEDSSVSPPPPPLSELPPPPPPVPPNEPDIIANQQLKLTILYSSLPSSYLSYVQISMKFRFQVDECFVFFFSHYFNSAPVSGARTDSACSHRAANFLRLSNYYGRSGTTAGGVFIGGEETNTPPLPPGILPPALERTIKVKKEEEALGINVELVDEGKNGVMVTSVAIGGPFARDGRIHAGDFLVAINNESMRNVTNAQARAILRRAQLFSKDLSLIRRRARCFVYPGFRRGSAPTDYRDPAERRQGPEHWSGGNESRGGRGERVYPEQKDGTEEASRDLGSSPVSIQNILGMGGGDVTRLVGAAPAEEAELPEIVKPAVGSSVRTPADGQEAPLIDKKFPPATTTTTTARSQLHLPQQSTKPHHQYFARSTPPVVPAKPGYLSGATTTTETSTVFINTSEIPVPQATQPTVQKRVVTHVTIFPSPPPDLVTQVSRVTTTTTAPTPKPQALNKQRYHHTTPPPAPVPDQEVSISDEPTLSVSVSASEPSAAQAAVVGVVKSEPNTASLSLQQSSSLEMVNKEPLSSSEKESSHTPTPSTTTVKGGANWRRRGGGGGSSGDESSALLLAKHWGPERLVQVHREPGKSLGISIVGGKVDLYNAGPDSGSAISGIFIKNVLLNSPAGRTGQLKTGDRILSVDDVDLRSASHEKAVEVIRAAGNPVRFLVQSLVHWVG